MKPHPLLTSTIWVAALLYTPSVYPASQALLVNVGDYQHESIRDLTATTRDAAIMRELLQQNPLFADTITTLSDQQATHSNVRGALRLMIEQLGEGDVGLFYFSGHGGQFKDSSGDEDDQRDEALILYDSMWDFENAKNVLLDDELAELYASVKQGKLIVLVDACNSGSLDKGLGAKGLKPVTSSEVISKSLGYIPVSAKFVDTQAYTEQTRGVEYSANYVAMHAADDDEQALLSPDGSYFTLGLQEILRTNAPHELTPTLLIQQIDEYINAKVPPGRRYKPQLRGNPELFERGLWLASATPETNSQPSRSPSLWEKLDQLAQKFPHPQFSLVVDPGDTIPIGEFYSLTFNLPFSGYLSIVAMDQGSQNPVILYPNAFMPEEIKYPAGALVLPPEDALFWGMQAQEPPSVTQLLAILSVRPLNLYAKSQSKGVVDANSGIYAPLSPVEVDTLSRATGVAATIAAARKIINIVAH